MCMVMHGLLILPCPHLPSIPPAPPPRHVLGRTLVTPCHTLPHPRFETFKQLAAPLHQELVSAHLYASKGRSWDDISDACGGQVTHHLRRYALLMQHALTQAGGSDRQQQVAAQQRVSGQVTQEPDSGAGGVREGAVWELLLWGGRARCVWGCWLCLGMSVVCVCVEGLLCAGGSGFRVRV